MSFRLTVDAARWRAHQQSVLAAEPGLVPVVKGRGYGLGTHLLAGQAQDLGVTSVAVGTLSEAVEVGAGFPGEILVLEPWTPQADADRPAPAELQGRLIRTLADAGSLAAALRLHRAASAAAPEFVIELDSSMHRHGLHLEELRPFVAELGRAPAGPLRGFSMHLPVRPGATGEVIRAAVALRDAGCTGPAWWLSHVPDHDRRAMDALFPGVAVHHRVGTRLWLGDPGALEVTGRVVGLHRVRVGSRLGYGRRRARSRTVVVVAGGTAHGVGVRAPDGPGRWWRRVGADVAGLAGVAPSPFSWQGRRLAFADVPHMQVSMLALPDDLPAPRPGDRLACRVRFTVSAFDEVVLAGDGAPAGAGAARA